MKLKIRSSRARRQLKYSDQLASCDDPYTVGVKKVILRKNFLFISKFIHIITEICRNTSSFLVSFVLKKSKLIFILQFILTPKALLSGQLHFHEESALLVFLEGFPTVIKSRHGPKANVYVYHLIISR